MHSRRCARASRGFALLSPIEQYQQSASAFLAILIPSVLGCCLRRISDGVMSQSRKRSELQILLAHGFSINRFPLLLKTTLRPRPCTNAESAYVIVRMAS